MQNLFNQFSLQTYFPTQYQTLILILFVFPSGQRTVLGEMLIKDSLHQILSPFHQTQLCGPYFVNFFSDSFCCPSNLSFFLEWNFITFHKYSMKSQTLSVYCGKQKVSHFLIPEMNSGFLRLSLLKILIVTESYTKF